MTATGIPSRTPAQTRVVHVRSSRFFHSRALANVSASGLNSENTLRDATRIIFRLARLTATVSRRGSSKNPAEAKRYPRSLSVALTRTTVRSPPWNRSTVSTADLPGRPVVGSMTLSSGNACCKAARWARCGTTTPRPSAGSSPYVAGSARARRTGPIRTCSNGFRTWLAASSWTTTTSG